MPGANDRVHFDENSFTLYSEISFETDHEIKAFFYEGVNQRVWFKDAGNHTLTVKGDFYCTKSIDAFSVANLVLTGKAGSTFKSAETVFTRNIEFAGKYSLEDLLATTGNQSRLLISKGEFKSNGYPVFADIIEIPSSQITDVDFGNSDVHYNHSITIIENGNLSLNNGNAKLFHKAGADLSKAIGIGGFLSVLPRGTTTCNEGFTVDVSITSNYNGSDISCNGECDGEITVTPFDNDGGPLGTGPYSCQIAGGIFPPGGPYTTQTVYPGLCAGSYTITCIDSSQAIVPGVVYETCSDGESLIDPFPLTFSIQATFDPSCPDSCDGQVFINTSGGTGTLVVTWPESGETGTNPTQLCVGENTVEIVDDNGCTIIDSVDIQDPAPFDLNFSVTNASCSDFCDGSVVANPSGGTGNPAGWTYDWNGAATPSGDGTDSIFNLCDGAGSLTITDDNGCPFTDNFTVTEPPALGVGLVNQVDLVCNNVCIGELEVVALSGTAPFGYQWHDATDDSFLTNPGNNTEHVTSLCAGTYYAVVTDGSGCIDTSAVFTVTEPPAITFTTSEVDATCFGTCDGEVSWTAAGGTGTITSELFLIGPPDVAQGTTSPVTGLCPGDYFVQHIDDNGCVQNSDTVTVDQPTQMVGTTSGVDPLCNAANSGEASVTIVGGSGAYTIEWFNDAGISTGQTASPATGLSADCYYVEITDALTPTCVVLSDTVCLIDPPPVTITVTPTDEQCFGACDGAATSVVSGGTGTLTVEWHFDPAPNLVGTGGSISSLCPDNYVAIVTDDNNCTASETFTITAAPALNITVVETPVTCTNACDGSAIATPTGGTGTLTVSWWDVDAGYASAGPDGNSISGLCGPINYAAIVTDDNGCTDTAFFFLDNPTPLITTTTITDETCFADCDGEIVVNASGGSGGYTYHLIPPGPPFLASNTFSGLCQGDYDVVVLDASGCTDTLFTETVSGPTEIILDLTITEETCFGDCDGSIEANPSGGTGGYGYTWTSSLNTTDTETGLCPSDSPVTLTVTDGSGCSVDSTITFSGPTVLDATVTITQPNCAGGTGSIDITATGGTPAGGTDYFFSTDGGATFTQAPSPFTFGSVGAGTYNVVVQDDNGCQYTETVVLIDPTGCVATTSAVPASCGGVCDGEASVTIVGCVGPFTHQWYMLPGSTPIAVAGGTTATITGLCSNLYFDSIVDLSTGCAFSSDTIAVTENPSITANVTFTDVTCNGFCDGTAQAFGATGGVTPYTYDWFMVGTPDVLVQSSAADNINGLCAAQYYLELVDDNGCRSAPVLFDVLENPPMDAPLTTTDATCFGVCNGIADLVPSGGDGNYTIVWDDITNSNFDFDPGSNASQNALCAADYQVTVTDGNGCSFGPQMFTISEEPEITLVVSATDESCFSADDGMAVATPTNGTAPITYTWTSDGGETSDTDTGITPGSYTVTATDVNGCTSSAVPFTIDAATEITATITPDVLLCNGDLGSISVVASGGDGSYNYQWDASTGSQTTNPATGLAPGTYCVDITDGLGCTVGPFCATIDPVTAVTASSSTTPALCNGACDGSATVTPAGGTGTYTYQWDASTGNQSTPTAVGLCAGTYSVTVTDGNGCSIVVSGIVVGEATALGLTITPTEPICFDGVDGSALISESGGTSPYTYLWDPATGSQTTNPATGLAAGTYGVTVTDDNGCTITDSVTIGEPTEITGTTSTTSATCGLVPCDGSATVSASGGTGTLTYQWFDSTPTALGVGTTESNLCAGAYTVEVTDDNGCMATFAAGVSNPAGEAISVNVIQDETCLGDGDGIAEVIFTCSTSPADCNISWSTGGNLNTETGMAAGSHTVTVTNTATGCISSQAFTIQDGDELTLSMSTTPEQCYNACDGTTTVSASGGDGIYTYLWDDPSTQNTATAFNLCGNLTYTATVTDGQGCSAMASIAVDTAAQMFVSTTGTDATCDGLCDGIGTALPTGGAGGYTYQWDDAATQTTQGATGLCPGSYNVTVTDQNGCSIGATSATIGTPAAITNTISSTPLLCNGDTDATATASPAGGGGIYTYNWQQGGTDLVPPQTSQTAVDLAAGTYTVQVTDQNGCVLIPDDTVVIVDPTIISATSSSTPETCDGDADGSATVVPAGGTPVLSVQWDPTTGNQTGNTATNLADGTYTATISDGNGCTLDVPVTVTTPGPINSGLVTVSAGCFEDSTGSATVNVTGGTPGFDIDWSTGFSETGVSTSTISNLGPGNYSVDIADANGCNGTFNFVLTENPEITALFTVGQSTCTNSDGSLTVNPSGGTPNYTYAWQAPATGTGQTTSNSPGLPAGCYDVIVTDDAGCSETFTGCITDINAESLTASVTDESCFGDCDGEIDASSPCVDAPCTYELLDASGGNVAGPGAATNFPGLCADDYIVSVTNASGCVTFENVTVAGPGQIFAGATITEPGCSGAADGEILLNPSGGVGPLFTINWTSPPAGPVNPLTGQSAGSYDVTITDQGNGCTLDTTITLTDPSALGGSTTSVDPLCFGDCNGSITVSATGGTPGYQYSINGGVFQTSPLFGGLCDGSYDIQIMDSEGCTFDIPGIVITEPTLLTISSSGVDPTCFGLCDGEVSASASGGTGAYTFTWDGGLGTGSPITGVCDGTYNVSVTDDNGCSAGPSTVTLTQPTPIDTTDAGKIDVVCNGDANGEAFVVVTGGTVAGDYNYFWGPAALPNNDTVTNLSPGAIWVYIEDDNGCQMDTIFMTINEPTQVTATTSSVPANCLSSDGSATVNPSGGTVPPPYTYLWDASTGSQTTQTATNLPAGSYNVTVTDGAGCQEVFSVPISNVDAPEVTFAITDVSCFDEVDGAIDATISAGTPPYTMVWSPGGQTTEDISGLDAGLYQITITDAVGCITIADTTIGSPTEITATFNVTDATCGTLPCNGDATVVAAGGSGIYNYMWSSGGITDTETGLCAGLYDVVITDNTGCSETFTTALNDIGGPTGATVTANNVSCFGDADGDATLAAVGGTAPYSYLWTHDLQGGDTHLNLSADDYFVQIVDSNGCMYTHPLTITEPPALGDSAVFTPPTCTLSDGEIEVFISGGTPGFSYDWIGMADTDSILDNAAAGTYDLEVTQANGCVDTLTYSLSDADAPVPSFVTTDVTCNGNCDGSVTTTVTGGTLPMTAFEWLDDSGTPIGQPTQDATGLCAGDYTLQVTDNAGCIGFGSTTIDEPNVMTATVPSSSDASCLNVCNGTASAIVIGGTLPYSYQWTPGGQITASVTDLCVGVNDVLVTDVNGCTISQSITINENNTLAATVATTDATCGLCDGDATVTPTGGSGGYTVTWSDGFVGTTQSNLCAGVYSYDIVDSDGCEVTLDATLNNIGGPTGETVNITDVSCFGLNDGAADVTPIGGTPPYSYLWVPGGSTTNSMTGLGVGTYNVEVADSNGCIRVVPVTVGGPDEMTLSSFVINEDCGQANGAITVFTSGGVAPYAYSWTGGLPASDAHTGVAAGVYDVTVTDASGCSETFSVVVNSTTGPSVSASSTNVSCFGACDGTGTAVATGGSGSFSYLWSSGGAAANETGMCAGTHTITVTDNGSGCITSTFVVVSEPDSIAMSFPNIIDATCGGTCDGEATVVASGGDLPYTYSWPSGGNSAVEGSLCAGTYTVDVTDASGCTQTQDVTITEPTPITIALDSVDASCTTVPDGGVNAVVGGGSPGYTHSWTGPTSPLPDNDTISNVFAGVYYLTVTDQQGCSVTDSIEVIATVVVIPDAGPDTSFCFGTGPITLTGTGTAVSFEWFDLSGASLSTADTLDVNATGCYVLVGIDGLCTNNDTVCVTVNPLPVVDAGDDQAIPTTASTVIGGSPTTDPGFTVVWTPSNYLDDTSAHNPNVIAIDTATTYIVMVTDTNGCVAYDTVFVDIYPEIVIPSGFTPNGDGLNDDWEIDLLEQFPEVEVEVYNRWGQQLFYNVGYTQRWDGRYDGRDLPEGTYYYVIKLNHPVFPEPYTGPVTIMR